MKKKKQMMKHVKYYAKDVNRDTFRERIDGTCQPYKLANDAKKI